MNQVKTAAIVTMKDVALAAGVSTATVSRALMTPEKVSFYTQQKVEKAVQQTGYVPAVFGRYHKEERSNVILVMVQDINALSFSDIIKGIQHTATQKNHSVLLLDSQQQTLTKNLTINLIHQACGVIVIGTLPAFLADINKYQALPPIIMADDYFPELMLPTIHSDNLTAMFNAVNYLQQLGHQRIAYIAGPENQQCSQYRRQGYLQALSRSAIALEKSYLLSGAMCMETGANALSQLMSLPQPPSAIVCHNDVIAIGAISQAKKDNIDVPTELSIIGFDNIALAQYMNPPLTTVAQPKYQIGCQAVSALLGLMQGCAAQLGSILLESELIIRESTAKPHQLPT